MKFLNFSLVLMLFAFLSCTDNTITEVETEQEFDYPQKTLSVPSIEQDPPEIVVWFSFRPGQCCRGRWFGICICIEFGMAPYLADLGIEEKELGFGIVDVYQSNSGEILLSFVDRANQNAQGQSLVQDDIYFNQDQLRRLGIKGFNDGLTIPSGWYDVQHTGRTRYGSIVYKPKG